VAIFEPYYRAYMFLKLLFASLARVIIKFHLNTTLFLKVKDSYTFQLAEVVIIRLNVKKIYSYR